MYNMNILSQWLKKLKSNHFKHSYYYVENSQDPTTESTCGCRFGNTFFDTKKVSKQTLMLENLSNQKFFNLICHEKVAY